MKLEKTKEDTYRVFWSFLYAPWLPARCHGLEKDFELLVEKMTVSWVGESNTATHDPEGLLSFACVVVLLL